MEIRGTTVALVLLLAVLVTLVIHGLGGGGDVAPTEPRLLDEALSDETRAVPAQVRDAPETRQTVPLGAEAGPDKDTGLLVRVLDPEGEPVAGAEVRAWARADRAADEAHVFVTDRTGLGTLVPQPEPAVIWVEAASGELRSDVHNLNFETPGVDGAYVLTLAGWGSATGVVLAEDGSPFAGARVLAARRGHTGNQGKPEPGGETESATDGSFTLPLRISRAGYRLRAVDGDRETSTVEVRVDDADPRSVELRFGGGLSVAGWVVRPDGSWASQAFVRVWQEPETERSAVRRTRFEESVPVGVDGRFEVQLPHPGDYRVMASAPESCTSEIADVPVTDDSPRARVELALVEPTFIAGRIVWASGEPASSMPVAALRDERDEAVPGEPIGTYSEEYFGSSNGFAQTTTAADGSFRLEPVRPGARTYQVMCVPDLAKPRNLVHEFGVSPRTQDLEIVLSAERARGGTVAGRVVTEDGSAAGHHYVTLHRRVMSSGRWTQVRSLQGSGPDFAIEGLVPGSLYALTSLGLPGYLPQSVEPWVAGLEEHGLRVRMMKARQLDVAIEPAPEGADVGVVVRPAHGGPPASEFSEGVGRNGQARFLLAPGSYEAHWETGGWKSEPRTFVLAESRRLVLDGERR